MKIAFLFPVLRPDRCGVSDYSLRMAALLTASGHECALLCNRLEGPSREGIETLHGAWEVAIFDRFDLVAVQYTPSSWKDHLGIARILGTRRSTRVLWMIHEFWNESTPDHRLTLREWASSLRDRILAGRFRKQVRPELIATSNPFYAELLNKHGFPCTVLPIVGTIPPEPIAAPPDSSLPGWWTSREGWSLWVSFGSLYTSYWPRHAFVEALRDAHRSSGLKFAFVVCAKQSEEDREAFIALLYEAGIPYQLHFTGSIPTAEINWWFSQADASLAGTGYENWEKSTGVLTAVERGVPVWLVRGTEITIDGVERHDLLVDQPSKAVTHPKSLFNSRHHPLAVSRVFESLADSILAQRE
jgi:hypothetical protein